MQQPPEHTGPTPETERPHIPAVLRGPRVPLRRLDPGDAPAVWEALEESRPRLTPWLPWVQAVRSVEDELAHISRMRDRWDRREDLPVRILDAATGRYLGGSGLHRMAWNLAWSSTVESIEKCPSTRILPNGNSEGVLLPHILAVGKA